MAKETYPQGLPYIIGNEAAERFSYYGMKCILVVYMTTYLRTSGGTPMTEEEAKFWYHIFGSANYLFPILGALVADIVWGKYLTIIRFSVIYCIGHLILALFENQLGLAAGLTCIAIGSGGIKPCVSSHLGDQFRKTQNSLIERAYSLFYLSINLGAFLSTLLTPILLKAYGPSVAFGVPGALMLIATFVFWKGRESFIAIPATGWPKFNESLTSAKGLRACRNLSVLYLFIALFWALFDQTGSSWVLQAKQMDTTINLFGVSIEVLPSQLQALNPILILILVPLISFFLVPIIERKIKCTPLRKIGLGFILAAISFFVIARAEQLLLAGQSVSVSYQLIAYCILTTAEVLISITALEFSYTQAPLELKSFIMGLFFLSVSLGNLFTAAVNSVASHPLLSGPLYFVFFGALLLLTTLFFVFFAISYKGEEQLFE